MLVHEVGAEQRLQLVDDVAVAQGHALGRAGRAGSVEQRRHVFRLDLRQFCIGVREQASPTPLVVICDVEQDGAGIRAQAIQEIRLLRGGEDELRLAALQYAFECHFTELRVEGHGHGAGAYHRETGRHPLGPVGGEERHAVAALYSRPDQPVRHAERVLGELPVGPALGALLVQRQHRRPVAEFG